KVLREVRAEQRAIRALLEARQPIDRAKDSAADVELVHAIHGVMSTERFAAWQIIDLALDGGLQYQRLRAAIEAALSDPTSQCLGITLRRLDGRELNGLMVVREGEERGAALWRLRDLRD